MSDEAVSPGSRQRTYRGRRQPAISAAGGSSSTARRVAAVAAVVVVPAVALALTTAQGLTIRAMADAGAALDGGSAANGRHLLRTARHVAHLLDDVRAQRRMAAAGQALVDGRGIFRVADKVRELAAWAAEARHAA